MTQVLKVVPEHQLANFSFETWAAQSLPGRTYSVSQAVHSDAQYASLVGELQKLMIGIRLNPSAEMDLMGLPLSEALIFRSKALENKRMRPL